MRLAAASKIDKCSRYGSELRDCPRLGSKVFSGLDFNLRGSSMFHRLGLLVLALIILAHPVAAHASGGGGGSAVDTIKVSKCYYLAGATTMLIKASSSDPTARLFAYLPDGQYLGELQNGGGSRYGGTVVGYYGPDPVYIHIVSSSGGSVMAHTTPFQQ